MANICPPKRTKFSFGASSAIITNLGLIAGLQSLAHPKLSMIGGILVIALADNISDSLGIHIFQESECLRTRDIWVSTLTNFLSRLVVSLTFVFLILFLPMHLVAPISLGWGLLLLAAMSFVIARDRGVNPYLSILEHLAIAVAVITLSNLLGQWIVVRF